MGEVGRASVCASFSSRVSFSRLGGGGVCFSKPGGGVQKSNPPPLCTPIVGGDRFRESMIGEEGRGGHKKQ